jgi:uncharacterized protein
MKIAVIGATGKTGSRIVNEVLARGHSVTGIARRPEILPPHERLTMRPGDVRDAKSLVPLIAGHDAVVTAIRYLDVDLVALIGAVKEAGVQRLLAVGGAGSLVNASGRQLLDAGEIAPAVRPASRAGRAFLMLLKSEARLDWTYLSPSAEFAPGKRTGKFRLGDDALLVAADGTSAISMEDFAIALADEIETPRHSRRRFTVGY